MSTGLDRAANMATVAIALSAVIVTLQLLVGGTGATRTTASVKPDSAIIDDWRRYLLGGHTRGPKDAPVTILEFGDYECPFCARFATEIDRILAAFPGKVRFVYRHWPLSQHRFAYPAARAAECAGQQGRFWEYHDILYAKSDSLGLLAFSEIATRAKVGNVKAFEVCNALRGGVPAIDRGESDAEAVGGVGTPTLLVNGVRKSRVDSAYVASVLDRLGKIVMGQHSK